MTHPFRASVALVAGLAAYAGVAHAQGDPPGTVGRLAFADGSVSFHDQEDDAWTKAIVNTPLTSGDGIWTEPQAHSELSMAGTRVRLDGATQLDMLSLDDSQTRLQLGQGRLDVRAYTLDSRTPYRIVTPRGTITLRQQGDYYVQAGSTEDATRLGVRSGSAELVSLDGQTMTIQPGQVGEISGDAGAPQLRTLNTAPPALPAYWAVRDKQVTYDPPTQYLSAGVTGYEDMNAYGSWSKDSQYGDVWTPRSVPANWQPYRTGHWSNVKPWGWTWIDDQPWGYAPYHYGRWANRNNHWVWVPPQRDAPPVYAPALVAFIGGIELSVTLGNQTAPVGWFPLGPHETYVPSYTADRDYYNRINRSAQIQQSALDDRWQRTQRGQSAPAASGNVLLNQRFATVVPSEVFVHSQPVAHAVLAVSPEKIAAAPVALVAAPPAPTASLALSPAPVAPSKTPAAAPTSQAPKAPEPKAEATA
ncbi:MAG TPA: FecR family protein, partial [Acetobacteraceae bacterium]|nr:FecR family protein [Acetobacteraceae bacterium]